MNGVIKMKDIDFYVSKEDLVYLIGTKNFRKIYCFLEEQRYLHGGSIYVSVRFSFKNKIRIILSKKKPSKKDMKFTQLYKWLK
jgi:hypothetical protein